GRLQIRNWVDRDNNKRVSAEVVADECFFAEKKSDGGGAPAFSQDGGYNGSAPAPSFAPAPSSQFEELVSDDGELPF
ncbi:MAG: single-stranded DNA-binding protein, partial [Clostridia bacterium]